MNEDEYKDVYNRVIGTKCVFEKSILLQFAQCELAEKRLLAEREAINCGNESCQLRRHKFLGTLRQNARFSLQQTQADEPLPHAKELKVQAGGVFGLQQILEESDPTNLLNLESTTERFNQTNKPVFNINQLLTTALSTFGRVDNLPYSDMVKTIIRFEVRKKRKRR